MVAKSVLKAAKQTFLILIILIAAALVIELMAFGVFKIGLATRTTIIDRLEVKHPYHPYLGWDNPRSTTLRGYSCGGQLPWEIEINKEGLSITPHLNYKNPDMNIVVLGGSAMFGVGSSSNATTVPSLIEQELWERTGVKVEVYNLGVNGYMSFQEMLNLERFMAKKQIHVAVAVSGKNDAHYAAFENDWDIGLPLERIQPMTDMIHTIEKKELKVLALGLNLLGNRLRQRSNAIDLFTKLVERMSRRRVVNINVDNTLVIPREDEIKRRAHWTVTNYTMMDAMAKMNGVEYFMFLQPTAFTKNNLTADEKLCLDAIDQKELDHYIPIEKIFYDAIRRHEKTFTFNDISKCLDEISEPAYLDGSHYREVAARSIANAICTVITPVVVDLARKH